MAKKAQAEEMAVMDQPETVEEQPQEAEALLSVVVKQPVAVVLVEALVPMWGDNEVVPIGTRYHLPAAAAEYLAGLGFVAILAEEAD
jgi:hypothetical protein